ncbi:hypothetical protein GCM10010464_21270 [Pseudonocardia yunnanensis]|uniref:SDR family NAD(P)-dependent oxidoreductase n=1 Tax=Pseudonocardia yunnanensis TaxID=58107 RepID=A0ABW4EPR7_9PSEU
MMSGSARLGDRVALVTGAGSRIGAGVVHRFVGEGARVVAVERDGERLERVVEPLGDRAVAVRGDVTDPGDCRRAVEVAVDRFGRLDVVVSNAGVHDQYVALTDLTTDQLDRAYEEVFAVNVKGALLMVHAAIHELIRNRGSIVFTGSISKEPDQVARRLPTGVAPEPADVCGIYAMLASDSDGSAVTGSVITVDAGQLLWGPVNHHPTGP